MSWWEENIIAFDLETTSADPEEARIVSVGLVELRPDGSIESSYETLVDPGVPIPAEASEIHGIKDVDVLHLGCFDAYFWRVMDFIDGASTLVVYNARYDLTVLDRELRRHSGNWFNEESVAVIDPFVIDKHLDRYRRGSRKLTATAEHYGVDLSSAHDASADALAAGRLAQALGGFGRIVRRTRNAAEEREFADLVTEWETLKRSAWALHGAQKIWAAAQADGLEEHLRAQGDSEAADGVSKDWPVIGLPTQEDTQ